MNAAPSAEKTRVSTSARIAVLKEWLTGGYSPSLALHEGLKTWPVRASRLRKDIDGILKAWVAEDERQDRREVLAQRRREKQTFLDLALRQLRNCIDSPQFMRLLALCRSMARERDRATDEMDRLNGKMGKGAFQPLSAEEAEEIARQFQDVGHVSNVPG